MARQLFGTDGVRGLANADLTPDLALQLGRAAARLARERGATRPHVLIGRDTRRSGPMLEDALCAGIASAGGVALRAGVLPTPGVAWLARAERSDLGAVVSASHNPYPDNGIKLFGGDGFKLTDAAEERVETLLGPEDDARVAGDVGWSEVLPRAAERYATWIAGSVDVSLEGIHLVVDCAHGAATTVAPMLFERLGVRTTVVGDHPDGTNINVDCGSTHLRHVADAVRAAGADLGVAFDGDADRVLAVDAAGNVVDGDHILVILARDALRRDALPDHAVVLTSMANLGAHRALEALGVTRLVTDVGDRYVLEEMRRSGAVLGGEQSGHVIALDRQTTGDGLVTATMLLAALVRAGESLADAARLVVKYPQRLVNVRADRRRLAGAEGVWAAVRASEERLGADGRVVLRASGTESLVRVMVEAATPEICDEHCDALVEVVRAELGLVEEDIVPRTA
jgi:phosphoglucosamine mutase